MKKNIYTQGWNNARAFRCLAPSIHDISFDYHDTMTTSSTKINEWPDSPRDHSLDADWVMVNENDNLTNDSFEMIDAAEARCWCGGADADRCRRQGHSWPLCDVDQSELWPDPNEDCHQSHEEGNETGSTDSTTIHSTSERSDVGDTKETTQKPKSQSPIDQPGFYESGPFTKLSVLTDLLDKGRYSGT